MTWKLTFGGSPWVRDALAAAPDREATLRERAAGLGVAVSGVGSTPRGPWVIHVIGGGRSLRFAGRDLHDMIGFGLDRWMAGADDKGIRWTAGADGLAHGHRGRPETLCGLPWTDERFAHPERARCRECWVALDRRLVAA